MAKLNVCLTQLVVIAICSSAWGELIVVDNFSESGGGGYGLRFSFFGTTSSTVAQQFDTGGDTLKLGTISTSIWRDTASLNFQGKLWSTDVNDRPGSLLTTMSLVNNPIAGGYDRYQFRPDVEIYLSGQAKYFFSIEDLASTNSAVEGSVFGSNNYVGPGNLYENIWISPDSGQTWTSNNVNAIVMQVTSVPEGNAVALSLMGMFTVAMIRPRSRRRRLP
ncbi:MAG: choice-of-anchor R domain-containing protein [Pirellulaceae bacterium]